MCVLDCWLTRTPYTSWQAGNTYTRIRWKSLAPSSFPEIVLRHHSFQRFRLCDHVIQGERLQDLERRRYRTARSLSRHAEEAGRGSEFWESESSESVEEIGRIGRSWLFSQLNPSFLPHFPFIYQLNVFS